jgi:hypothetical protein
MVNLCRSKSGCSNQSTHQRRRYELSAGVPAGRLDKCPIHSRRTRADRLIGHFIALLAGLCLSACSTWRHGESVEGLNTAGIAEQQRTATAVSCIVGAGGVVLMRPLLIHASSAASKANHRRVIHVDYASCPSMGACDGRPQQQGILPPPKGPDRVRCCPKEGMWPQKGPVLLSTIGSGGSAPV